MYIQCKQGFVEADRWDGQLISIPSHQALINKLARRKHGFVCVLRSREQATLVELLARVCPERPVYESPAGWDYQWRAYVTSREWAQVLSTVAGDLDYRNFKSWTTAHKPGDHQLAHDIWHVAHQAGTRKQVRKASKSLFDRPWPRGGAY